MVGVIPGNCFYTGKLVRFGYVSLQEKSPAFLAKARIYQAMSSTTTTARQTEPMSVPQNRSQGEAGTACMRETDSGWDLRICTMSPIQGLRTVSSGRWQPIKTDDRFGGNLILYVEYLRGTS